MELKLHRANRESELILMHVFGKIIKTASTMVICLDRSSHYITDKTSSHRRGGNELRYQ